MDHTRITVESVSNLQGNGRQLLEDILGLRLQDNQQVFIMVLSPGTEPDEAARREARLGVEATFRKTEAYAAEHDGMTLSTPPWRKRYGRSGPGTIDACSPRQQHPGPGHARHS
jgi:hypothetical protein